MIDCATRLLELLGPEKASADPQVLAEHAGDKWFASTVPEVVVFASETADVATVMQFASTHGIPVTPRGSGYGYVGGCVPVKKGIVLSLARMNRILEIHFNDGVAVVQSGVITGELQSAVRAVGLYYPPDPASLKECSIGGNIATNAGGPRCLKYGVTRSYLLGLEVVLPNGNVVRCGGRTHKNKTGFDLIGLFTGSEGMLGVVTEATLRLLPLPPARASLSASFASAPAAAAAVQAVFHGGFLPAALEVADAFTLDAARKYLGRGLVPDGQAHLLIDLDGQHDSVASEAESLRQILQKSGALSLQTAVGEEDCEKLWDLRRGFSFSLRATGLIKLNEDVVVPRGRLVDMFAFGAHLQEKYGFPVACFGHAGDGNIHVNIMCPDYEKPEVRALAETALDELFTQVLAWGGVITGEHGVGLAKKRWWPQAVSENTDELHRILKKALDPQGILNPGKFLG
ncbi:MAG: FAD-linked oxidase C-terminal domain-containing protein [Chthoniobacterales bacterium]